MQAPKQQHQEESGKGVDDQRIEDENADRYTKISFLGSKKHISRFRRVIFLLHLGVGEHIGNLLVLEQLFRRDLIILSFKLSFPLPTTMAAYTQRVGMNSHTNGTSTF